MESRQVRRARERRERKMGRPSYPHEQLLNELASDLSDLVASGDLTDLQANEWLASKADQWSREG